MAYRQKHPYASQIWYIVKFKIHRTRQGYAACWVDTSSVLWIQMYTTTQKTAQSPSRKPA